MKQGISGVKYSIWGITAIDENGNEILSTTKVCNNVCHFVAFLLTVFLFSFSLTLEGVAALCLIAAEYMICWVLLNALSYALLRLFCTKRNQNGG